MDGVVRSLLQAPVGSGVAAVDPRYIMKAYEEEIHKLQDSPEHQGSTVANQTAPGAGHPPMTDTDAGQSEEEQIRLLLEQLRSLEERNCTLTLENTHQRETYERCLDEVANQVVLAVLTQKDLREECVKLRTRVLDLEQQNRALSILFQQQLRPTSQLLLQKLQSRITGLVTSDLLSDPDVGKAPPAHEVQLSGRAGLPVSLSGAVGAFQHSSCSSSEMSLSSAGSDFSSGSFTWNEGRAFGQMASLSRGTRAKEGHVLEGLRRLQRRRRRSAPPSSRSCKAAAGKDCMNSNEGIYSPGVRGETTGPLAPPYPGPRSQTASCDSDDADDESVLRGAPGADNWTYCRKPRPPRSPPDAGGGAPGYDRAERPEKLTSFLTGRGRPSAFTRVSPPSDPRDPEEPVSECGAGGDPRRTRSAEGRPGPLGVLAPERRPWACGVRPWDARPPVSPLRLSKGCSTDPRPPGEDPSPPSPLSPPVKLSRFIKTSGGRRPDRGGDRGEEPTRDRHCEPAIPPLRTPSPPPPPPGRSASLLVKPGHAAGSPQARQTRGSAGAGARGPPPRYPPPAGPEPRPAPTAKARDSLELDAGYGTALAPQKLDHTAAPSYLPPAAPGCSPDRGGAPQSPKDGPPPYGAPRGAFQGTFVTKRGRAGAPALRTRSGLPETPRDPPHPAAEPPATAPPRTPAEQASKTRTPAGFTAFLRSPSSHPNGPPVPGKPEKNRLNSVCRGPAPATGRAEEETPSGGGGKRRGQLFLRSVSVGTKPHLRPALGMNGAKARSQSFSANHTESPAPDAPGKTRTHIITNSGERGSAPEVAGAPALRSPPASPPAPRHGGAAEEEVSPPTGGVPGQRAPPVTARGGLRNVRKPSKVASHPQCRAPSARAAPASSESRTLLTSAAGPREAGPDGGPKDPPESPEEEKRVSCTMEEKVMMGIEENVQKCLGRAGVPAGEPARQRTGPSLANWFGLRRSKLPALGGGKKGDPPEGKEDKEEKTSSSAPGGRPARSDRRREKRRSDCGEAVEGQKVSQSHSRLSAILDQCHIQLGHMQRTAGVYAGSEPTGKELLLLDRTASTGHDPEPSTLACMTTTTQQLQHSAAQVENQTCSHATVSHMMTLEKGQEGVPDHVIGSSCQMRTLDSGIGTGTRPPAPPPPPPPHLPGGPPSTSASDPARLLSPAPPSDRSGSKRWSLRGSWDEQEQEEEQEQEQEEEQEQQGDGGMKSGRRTQAGFPPTRLRLPGGETLRSDAALPVAGRRHDNGLHRPETGAPGSARRGQSGDSLGKERRPVAVSSWDSVGGDSGPAAHLPSAGPARCVPRRQPPPLPRPQSSSSEIPRFRPATHRTAASRLTPAMSLTTCSPNDL